MRRFASMAGLIVVLAGLAPWAAAQGDAIRIGVIGSGGELATPIAVPPIVPATPDLATVAREMSETLAYDLDFCGVFTVLPATSYPPTFTGFPTDANLINLAEWTATNVAYIVYGLLQDGGSQYVVQFRLYDLAGMQQVIGRQVSVPKDRLRLAPHRFSEDVIEQIDVKPGIGTTEIVFSGGQTGNKEIYVADYDGANLRRVTQHQSISILPKFSPDNRKIAYLSYKDRYPFLYIFDRDNGQSRRFSAEVGLNLAPSWAPDGSWLALTLSKDGNAEIYRKNVDGSGLKRLTNNRHGDAQPAISPDGSRIAYVSDRGNPQIYVMNIGGGEGTRISVQGGSSYDPAWSPDGSMLAYAVERRGEGVQIYVAGADGSNARRVTSSPGNKEQPNWSADGRHLIFMSKRGGNQLWTVTLSTLSERPVPRINLTCEGPNWGKVRMR
jgi:TolB protein